MDDKTENPLSAHKYDAFELQTTANQYVNRILGSHEPRAIHIEGDDVAAFIVSKLMRRNFRRRVGPDTFESVKRNVAASVKEQRPVHFVIPFCASKHFWNSSYPEPDWAELFHLHFMTEHLLPIAAAHEPGIIVEYISQDLILSRLDNYPEEALEAYSTVFPLLLKTFQALVPANFEFRYSRLAELCDGQALVDEVERSWPARREWFASLSDDAKERHLTRSRRSVMWNGKQDLSSLPAEKQYDRIVESRLIELTFLNLERDPKYLGNYLEDDRIRFVFSYGMSPDNNEWGELTLHTSRGSGVDFWTGRGVLRLTGEGENTTPGGPNWRIHGTILSRSQYDEAANALVSVSVDRPPIDRPNFQRVEIV